MSLVSIVDVKKICRVCLGSELEMKFLFDCQQSPTIAEMLSELTIYQIKPLNELPHLICSECLNLVLSAYKLKSKCEESHRTLIALLDSPQRDISLSIREIGTQTLDEELLHAEHSNSSKTCRCCSRSFKCTEDLKTHIAVFHPEADKKILNECHICKRQFTKGVHLIRHIQSRHTFLKVEIKSKNDQEIHECSFEEEAPEIQLGSKEIVNETEILKLIQLEDVDCLTDEENEIPLKLLLESSKTSEIREDILNKSLEEEAEIFLESQNSMEMEENDGEESNLTIAKRTRGRPAKLAKTEADSNKNLQDESTFNDSSGNSIQTRKRGRGRPSRNPFKCKYCSKYYDNEPNLQQHIADSHMQSSHFSCKICNENFSAKKDLIYHLSIEHKKIRRLTSFMRSKKANLENLFYCTKCDKNFSSKNSLQRHQENHDKKRYVCKECLEEFANKEDLSAHTKREGHDKPLLCPECGLRCKSSNILTVHLRRHNGEKPFKCKFCSKGFPRIDDLKIHEKYHTGEKSHFCDTCGKGFFRKYNLRIHLRVHTGEKPHKCPHCPQAFAQSNDLKAHIRRHTGERFRCEICNAGFLQGYQIRQHKLQEHGIHEKPPTQRVQKFTSAEEQEEQIKQNLEKAVE